MFESKHSKTDLKPSTPARSPHNPKPSNTRLDNNSSRGSPLTKIGKDFMGANMFKALKFFILVTFMGPLGHQASAEMSYSPVLPQFGGTNGQALTVLQFDLQLQSAADAEEEAAALALERAMAPATPPRTSTDKLISSIEAALQARLAFSYADQIFTNIDTAAPVSIELGETTITYSRTDGFLTIDIIDDVGAATQFGIDLGER
jgi:hypothetical protein